MMHERRKNRSDDGFTVVELMVSLAVMMIAVLGAYTSLYASMVLVQGSNERLLAARDAETVLEDMRATAIRNVTLAYPPSELVPEYTGKSLTDEKMVVTYPNGSEARPLLVEITVDWRDHRGRTQTLRYHAARSR